MNKPGIKQKIFLKGSRSFSIQDKETLRAIYCYGRSKYELTIKLSDLEPEPRYDCFFPVGMFMGILILGLPALGMFIGAAISNPISNARVVFSTFFVILSFFTILCAIGLWRQQHDLFVFVNSKNANDSIVLFNGRPNLTQFNAFIEHLKSRIIQTRVEHSSKWESDIVSKAKELIALKEKGILSDDELTRRVKAQIIEGRD